MMRRCAGIVVALGCAGSLAFATGSTASLGEDVLNALSLIDVVPTQAQLDVVFAGAALPELSRIAKDTTVDIGIRLRAIHALAKYCPDPCAQTALAHESLTSLINLTKNETVGEPVVLLRAAIETIGTLQVSSDAEARAGILALLAPLLDHASRDIRAATARALRDLCNTGAITPLRVRYTNEPTDQVKLAISEALRVLGQCGP
jgi:HEAT repeats